MFRKVLAFLVFVFSGISAGSKDGGSGVVSQVLSSESPTNSIFLQSSNSKEYTGYTTGDVLRLPEMVKGHPMCWDTDRMEGNPTVLDRKRQLLRWKNVLENLYFRHEEGTKGKRLSDDCLRTYRENWESDVDGSDSPNADLIPGHPYDYDAIGIGSTGRIDLSKYQLNVSKTQLQQFKLDDQLESRFTTQEKDAIEKAVKLVSSASTTSTIGEWDNDLISDQSDDAFIDRLVDLLDVRPKFARAESQRTDDGIIIRTMQYTWQMADGIGIGDRLSQFYWLVAAAAHLEKSSTFQEEIRREDERVTGPLPANIRYRVQIVTSWPGETHTTRQKGGDKTGDKLTYMNPSLKADDLERLGLKGGVELIAAYKSSVFFQVFQGSFPENVRLFETNKKLELYTGIEVDSPTYLAYGMRVMRDLTRCQQMKKLKKGEIVDRINKQNDGESDNQESSSKKLELVIRLPFSFDACQIATIDAELERKFKLPKNMTSERTINYAEKRAIEYELTRRTLLKTIRIRLQFQNLLKKFTEFYGGHWHSQTFFTKNLNTPSDKIDSRPFHLRDVTNLFDLKHGGLEKRFGSSEDKRDGRRRMHLLLPKNEDKDEADESSDESSDANVLGLMLVDKDIFSYPVKKVVNKLMDAEATANDFDVDDSDYEIFPLVLSGGFLNLYDFSAKNKNIHIDAWTAHYMRVDFVKHDQIFRHCVVPSQSLSTAVVNGTRILSYDQTVKNFVSEMDLVTFEEVDGQESLVLDQLTSPREKNELVKLQSQYVDKTNYGNKTNAEEDTDNLEGTLHDLTNSIQARNRNFAMDTQKFDALERHAEGAMQTLIGSSSNSMGISTQKTSTLLNILQFTLLVFKIIRRRFFVPSFLPHLKYLRHEGNRFTALGMTPEKTYWELQVGVWGRYFKPNQRERMEDVGTHQLCYLDTEMHMWSKLKMNTDFLLDNAPPEYRNKFQPYLVEANPHVMGKLGPPVQESRHAIGNEPLSNEKLMAAKKSSSEPPPFFVLYLRLRHFLQQFADFDALRSAMAHVLRYMPGSLWNIPWAIVSDSSTSDAVASMRTIFTSRGLKVLDSKNETMSYPEGIDDGRIDWKLLEMYGDIALLSKASAILSLSARYDGWSSFVFFASQISWNRDLYGMATPIFTLVTSPYQSNNRFIEGENHNCMMAPVSHNVFHAAQILTFWQTVKCRVNVQKVAIYANQMVRNSVSSDARRRLQKKELSTHKDLYSASNIRKPGAMKHDERVRHKKSSKQFKGGVGQAVGGINTRETVSENHKTDTPESPASVEKWYKLRLEEGECVTSIREYDIGISNSFQNPLNLYLNFTDLEKTTRTREPVYAREETRTERERSEWLYAEPFSHLQDEGAILGVDEMHVDAGNAKVLGNGRIREIRREALYFYHPKAQERYVVPHRTDHAFLNALRTKKQR